MTNTCLTHRALIRLSADGPDDNVTDFLQGLVTNDVANTAEAPLPVYAALLSAQGKTLFDFLVWPDGNAVGETAAGDLLIDCEEAQADALVKRLSIYRLRRKITIAREDGLTVHWSPVEVAGAVSDPRLAALGWRWLAPAGSLQADPSGGAADTQWLAHRLSLGVAEGTGELSDILWLETNAAELNGVSFEKGCYIGQENTARMNWRQKINRRLVVVPLANSDPKRQKAAHHALGLAIDHLRTSDLNPADLPEWQAVAITQAE
jgi:folate-binding protein YgfZ